MSEQALMAVMEGLAILLREYREVSERIVARHDHNRYVLAADRDRLAYLNGKVNEIETSLQASLSQAHS